VVSHAGTVLLAELADRIGLTAALSEATDGLRERRSGHDPGRVLVDVAVAIADGARTISDVQVLADHEDLHGPAGSVASTPTIWRVLDGIDDSMLSAIRLARAVARDRAWLARGELTGSELPGSRAAGRLLEQVVIDLDATLVTAHSDKEGGKGNFKGGFGYHPLGAWLDNTGEALAAVLRPGNAGSNTAADHLSVVDMALTQLPDRWRDKPILIRADGAGYSHALIAADLLALAQSMLLTDQPDLHRAEPKTLRYRLLHTAARITRGQRRVFLRLAEHWPWTLALARAFTRLRLIPLPA
jgi:hypothetical protein